MELELPASLSERRRTLIVETADRLDREYGADLLGLVLSGSAGRGLDTELSDLDLLVIMTAPVASGPDAPRSHDADIEQIPLSVDSLETVVPFGDPQFAYRWSYAWAPVLADRTGGRIRAAIDAQTRFGADEAADLMIRHGRLGDWLNLTFRVLKSARTGRTFEARLDAGEALSPFLDIVFALAGLVRPYNSYLPWAVRAHTPAGWSADDLLEVIEQMLRGDPEALRFGVDRVHRSALQFATQRSDRDIPAAFAEWYPAGYGEVLGLAQLPR